MRESVLWLLLDVCRARKQGPAALALCQQARFIDIVAFARARSPYYRELHRDLPELVLVAEGMRTGSRQDRRTARGHRTQ